MLHFVSRPYLLAVLLTVWAILLPASAQAENHLGLEGPADAIQVGTPFSVLLVMDFSDTTVGGGVSLEYDTSILSLDQVSFAGGLGDDSDFQCPGSAAVSCPVDIDYISFGSVSGLSGQHTVATLSFTPIANGSTGISLVVTHTFGSTGGTALTVLLDGTAVGGSTDVPALSPWGTGVLTLLLLVVGFSSRRREIADRFSAPFVVFIIMLLASQPLSATGTDTDADGVSDSTDNCTYIANPNQYDSNQDGHGNRCDPDLDNDGDVDSSDLEILKLHFFGSNVDADLDSSGIVDFLDLAHMADQTGTGPGPSCGACSMSNTGTYTRQVNLAIPDGSGTPVSDSNIITDNFDITELVFVISISHSWIGDLTAVLTHVDTGTSVTVIDQPGVPGSSFGCSGDDIEAILSDDAATSIENECNSGSPAISGTFTPNNPLDAFDGESTAGTWTLAVSDSSSGGGGSLLGWSLEVNNPPIATGITMTAYRPQSETYSNPLQRRPVLEADEESPGAGVRINGDDDDVNGVADRDDASVTGENDLIEVELGVNQLAPAGAEYVLRRTTSNINVWESASKGTAILDDEEETILTFSTASRSVWVENPNGGTASLEFEARSTSDSSVLAADEIYFFPFTSLVIGLHGEFQFPTDPVYGPNEGISYLAVDFHEEAYDSHMYVENEVEADGSGSVYDEIVSAIQNRGVTQIALYGFSHGGGSIYDLSERLDANKGSIGSFDLTFTAYIDGIENDSDVDLDAEERLPIGTGYHVNYYQASWLWPVWGDSVPGADVDELVTGVSHITITYNPVVQSGIHDALVLRVPR